MVQALVVFMTVDFLLGVSGGGEGKKQSIPMSCFGGGVNKLLVLVMVGVGVILDRLVGMSDPYIRTAVIWFYIGREDYPLLKTMARWGLPLPGVIGKVLDQLKAKGGDDNA